MVSRDLTADGLAVFRRFAVQVLVAADAPEWRHGRHPEVIGIRADAPQSLLERHFDLESQAIDVDDVQGGQGQVGAHQQDGAALRMEYHDEADEDADGAPQQVGDPELQDHTLLAIDGAGRILESVGLLQQRCDLDLLPVLCGPAPAPGWPRGRPGGGGVAGKKATLLLLTRVTRWFPWASSPRTILPEA